MRKKFKQRILSAILCAAMVFQGVSYDALASQTSKADYEVQSQDLETQTQTTESEVQDALTETQTQTVESETQNALTETQTQTIESETQDSKTKTQSTETETIDEETTENETSKEETTQEETTQEETTQEITTELLSVQEAKEQSDDVIFEPIISFTGFNATINEESKITIANSDAYSNINFYLVQYKSDEIIAETRIYCFYDNDNDGVYTTNYYSSELLSDAATDVALMVELTDSSNDNPKTFTSKKFARTNKYENVKFSISNVTTGISRLDATIDYTGDMKFDSKDYNAYFNTMLYYGTESDESKWESTTSVSNFHTDDEEHSIYYNDKGLEAGKTYHGKIAIYCEINGYKSSDYRYSFYQEIKIDDFTMKEDGTIDFQTAFPDEIFRKVVANAIRFSNVDVTTPTVTLAQLESVTTISYWYSPDYDEEGNADYSNYEEFTPIKSIVGIDKLTNLEMIHLEYNEIDDITTDIDWNKLEKLEIVYLAGNNISKLPDFTSNTNLYWLDLNENLFSDETVKNITTKLPSGFDRYSIENQRTNGLTLITENNYYVFQGKSPLYIRPTGFKTGLPDTDFKFYIDGNEINMKYSNPDNYYYTSYYYNDDTGLLVGEHKIQVKATINGTEQTTKEYTFNIVDDDLGSSNYQYSMSSTPYINDEGDECDTFNDTLYYYANPNEIDTPLKAEIVDASGKVYAKTNYIDLSLYSDNEYRTDDRYTIFSISLPLDIINMGFVRTVDYIPVGDYNIKFTFEDGTTLIRSNQIKVFAKTPSIFILSSLSASWLDDNTISVYMESPNYDEADKDNYIVSLYTAVGAEIEGLITTVSKGVANSYIELNVTGLKKENADSKYYLTVYHNNLGSARTLSDDCYTDYFEGNGELIEIADSSTNYNWTYSIDNNELELGETATITVSGDNSNTATFSSSESDVVSITAKDGTATLTANKVGTSTITIKVGDSSKTVEVKVVSKKLKSISFENSSISVTNDGGTGELVILASPTDADFDYKNIRITVSNSKLLTAELTAPKSDSELARVKVTGKGKENNSYGDVTVTAIVSGTDLTPQQAVVTVKGILTEKTIYDYTNFQDNYYYIDIDSATTLADCTLPSGWEWKDPSAAVEIDTDNPYKPQKIKAIYNNKYFAPYKTDINVYVYKINEISIGYNIDESYTGRVNGNSDAINIGTQKDYAVYYDVIGITPYSFNNAEQIYEDDGIYYFDNYYNYYDNENDNEKYTWSVSDGDSLSLNSDGNSAYVTGIKEGSQTLQLTITLGSGESAKVYTSERDITVVGANIITDIYVHVQYDDDYCDYTSTLQPYKKVDTVVYANAEVLSDSKNTVKFFAYAYKTDEWVDEPSLTWSIIADKGSDGFATVNNEGLVTVKTAGSGMVRVTANDENGSYDEIRFVVSSFSPALDENSFTIYTKDSKILVPVTINPANPLKSVKLADNDFVKDNKITASLDSDGMIYLKSDATANATGNVKIIFATEYGDYTSEDIDVTIDTNLPTSTFKQTGVLNTFYSSDLDRSTPDAIFTVTSSKDYQIEDIELADNEKFGKVEYDGNTVSLWTTGLNSTTLNNFNNSVTANLKITYKDLGTVNQSVQVKTKSTPIKLAISGATVIKGNPTFTVSVTNANTKQAVGNIKVSIDNKSSVEKTSDDISNDGNVTLKYTGTKTANYTATFSSSDWTSQASAKGKITYVKTPKLVFGNKAAIVSEKATTSYVSVSISNTDVKIGDNVTITATGTGKKATEANEKLNVTFDLENQRIVAALKNPDAAQAKATYNYTVRYTLDENTTLTAKFNVNILASNNNTVTGTFKKKGTINLLNVNEYMTLTPTLVNTTAKIDSIDKYTVSSVATKTKPSEDVTDQFILEKLDSGELKLAYKNNEEVEKKLEAKQKYNVDVTFKLTDGTTAKATIKDVKPVAKLPSKTTATNTKGTLNLNQDKAFNTNIVTTSKTGSNAISKIVIADTSIKCKDKKAYSATELFDVDSINYEYNPSNAAVSIKLTDKAKELLASGKKYSVKLNVYYETGATTDPFKPVTLSITVK